MPRLPTDSSLDTIAAEAPAAGGGQGRARGPRPKLTALTIGDIARRAGVSKVTASRFLNEPHKVSLELRQRLEAVVRDTGYVPSQVARRLAARHGEVVGAVMQNVGSPTFAKMVRGLDAVFEAAGLQLMLVDSHYSPAAEARAVRAFAGWHPSALILTRPDHLPDTEALLRASRWPVVEAWELLDERPFHQVGFAPADVGTLVTEHFLAQGARRIRFVLPPGEDPRAKHRAHGYLRSMRAAGGVVDLVSTSGHDDAEAGAQALGRWAAEPAADRPRALAFANDTMALGALLTAPALGVAVPSDCAVAGFGDAPLAALAVPGLTTVRPQPEEIGRCTAETVLAALRAAGEVETRVAAGRAALENAPTAPIRRIVPCQLVVRGSSRIG